MALSIALSVIATTGTGIVLGSRLVYGMASYRALPGFLSNVSRRFATPVYASILVGVLIIVFSTIYYLATYGAERLLRRDRRDRLPVLDLLHHDRAGGDGRITGGASSAAWATSSPSACCRSARRCFLGWVLVQSMRGVPAVQNWSLVAIIAVGIVLMLIARFVFRSPFFQIRRESDAKPPDNRHGNDSAEPLLLLQRQQGFSAVAARAGGRAAGREAGGSAGEGRAASR